MRVFIQKKQQKKMQKIIIETKIHFEQRVVQDIIEKHSDLAGLHQIASTPINKFDLINKLNSRLALALSVESNTDFWCDRSLDGSEFTGLTDIAIPSWDEMLDEFASDQHFYCDI